jgi:outer membrane protein
MDNDVYIVPIMDLEYKSFFINQSTFGLHFFDGDIMKVSIVGAPRLTGYQADDSSDLSGMEDRDRSFDGGLRFQLKGEVISFTVTGLTDLFDEHQGQEVNATLSAELLEGALRPRVEIRWFSDDLVDYYYGVRSSEVATGRPIYQSGDTLNYLFGLVIGVPIDQRWALVGDIQYEVLGEDIEDSPIVDEDALFRFTAGIVYRF